MTEEEKQLVQLIHALKDSFSSVKKAYDNKKYLDLEKAKRDMMDIQERIARIVRIQDGDKLQWV
jgi:hypothetical protein